MDATCQSNATATARAVGERQCHGIGVGSGSGSGSGSGGVHTLQQRAYLGEHKYLLLSIIDCRHDYDGRWSLVDGCCSSNQWQASYMQSKGAGSANPTQLRVGGNMINP
jgi:hypothetical protein